MAAPAEQARVARAAILDLEQRLLTMLANGEYGEVAIEVTIYGLQPIVRVIEKGTTYKLRRGLPVKIERVG